MPFRFCAFACLLLLFAVRASAQSSTLPTLLQPLPATTLAAGSPAATLDLRAYFGLPDVSGQVAQFNTVMGRFNVELLADAAPRHVDNFIAYANAGAYANTFIHRSYSFDSGTPSIVQGGGYTAALPAPGTVAKNAAVPLEYNLPNAPGTLAAARTTDINSATSEWYFNVKDNSTLLGPSNGGGYTVFGRVLGTGMTVVDAIAALPTYPFDPPFDTMPLRNVQSGQTQLELQNFVTVTSVSIVPVYPGGSSSPAVLGFTATSSDPAVASVSVSGATLTVTPLTGGRATITVKAADANGNAATGSFDLTVGGTAPTITLAPLWVSTGGGSTVALTVGATGTAPLSYQWRKDGANVPGGTGETLILENVGAAQVGSYTVTVSNADGSATSSAAAVAVINGLASRLSNLSVRTTLTGGQLLTVGFVTAGGAKPILVRGVGPGLYDVFPQYFSRADVFADPLLELYNQANGARIDLNDNWAGGLSATFASVGAFALTPGSKDAALLDTVSGPHTAQFKGAGSGVALVEVYDTTTSLSPRLSNVSARNQVGTGANILIAGFVIDGPVARTVLIRGIGPALKDVFGVSGALADPKLEIFDASGVKLAENDNWSPVLEPYFDRVGAYRFVAGSKDAALLITLPGGAAYTVQVSGVGNTTGDGVVEVYEVGN